MACFTTKKVQGLERLLESEKEQNKASLDKIASLGSRLEENDALKKMLEEKLATLEKERATLKTTLEEKMGVIRQLCELDETLQRSRQIIQHFQDLERDQKQKINDLEISLTKETALKKSLQQTCVKLDLKQL